MNITEEIERAIGPAPTLPPATERLARGKRAVRRRRLAGVAALAAVGVLAGTAYTVAADEQLQVTTDPDLPIVPDALRPGHIVGFDTDGQLVRRDASLTVSKLVKNPADLDGAPNAAMVYERNGHPGWLFVYQGPDGSDYSEVGVDDGDAPDFQSWVEGLPEGLGLYDQPAWLDGAGTLHLAPGVTVRERVEHPLGQTAPRQSLGLAVEDRGKLVWMLLIDGGAHFEPEPAKSDYPNFEMWLDFSVALQTGQETLALVRFDAEHKLVARDGVTLVRQIANPQVGPDLASPGVPTAVAEVRYHGRTWFVMARQLPGEKAEYFPTVGKPGRGTMEEYLTHARVEYSGNQ